MEFGFLTQGYVPEAMRRADPDAEHTVLMDDLEVCQAADAAGFKYIWISEHHFLDEYSHISANDVFLGALASTTKRAHLGSGIFNPLPKVNHPAKVAEKVAMAAVNHRTLRCIRGPPFIRLGNPLPPGRRRTPRGHVRRKVARPTGHE